jgi:hypothetical protein
VEPISPELALIDPELARHSFEPAPVPRVVVRTVEPARAAWPQSAFLAVLLVSLALNGVLAARSLFAADRASPAPARIGPARSAGAVERELLDIVVRRPAGKLPSALIDPATGLAKSNLQATCSGSGPTFVCMVRPAVHASGEGLRVRYLPDGTFVWGSYAAKR